MTDAQQAAEGAPLTGDEQFDDSAPEVAEQPRRPMPGALDPATEAEAERRIIAMVAARSRARLEEQERHVGERMDGRGVASLGNTVRKLQFAPPGHVIGKCMGCGCDIPETLVGCEPCSRSWIEKAETQRAEEALRQRRARFDEGRDRALRTIPEKYADATFDSIETLKARIATRAAILAARDLVDEPLVLLVGGAGAGKTTLGCAMLRKIIDATTFEGGGKQWWSFGVKFAGAFFLAKARLEHALGHDEAPLVKEALKASVLLIDDLGIEKKRETVVAEVIYEREQLRKPMIITTSISPETAAMLYGDGVARRLFEESKVIRMKTPREVGTVAGR